MSETDEVLAQIRRFIAQVARDRGVPIFEPLDPEIEEQVKGEG